METAEIEKKCLHLKDWSCHAPNQEKETCIACLITSFLQDVSCLIDGCLEKKIKIGEAAPYYEKLINIRMQSLALSGLLQKNTHMKESEDIINIVPVDRLIKKFGGVPTYVQ
jgi:hypothetical protein